MKPITDYAPALEYGVYDSTATIVHDVPYNYPGTDTPVYTGIMATLGILQFSMHSNNHVMLQQLKL